MSFRVKLLLCLEVLEIAALVSATTPPANFIIMFMDDVSEQNCCIFWLLYFPDIV